MVFLVIVIEKLKVKLCYIKILEKIENQQYKCNLAGCYAPLPGLSKLDSIMLLPASPTRHWGCIESPKQQGRISALLTKTRLA